MKFNTFTTLATVFVAAVSAFPTNNFERRDVYTPPVTYPTAGTVWTVGEIHNVTWSVLMIYPTFR